MFRVTYESLKPLHKTLLKQTAITEPGLLEFIAQIQLNLINELESIDISANEHDIGKQYIAARKQLDLLEEFSLFLHDLKTETQAAQED